MINDCRGDKPSTYMGFISMGGFFFFIIQPPAETVILRSDWSKGSWAQTDFMFTQK